MPTIAVVNLKGGLAKTTTSVLLAEHAAVSGYRSIVYDLDPTGSATLWAAAADAVGDPFRCRVTPATASSAGGLTTALARQLEADQPEWAFLDTPPLDIAIITAATAVADAVIIPTRDSQLDAGQLLRTYNLVTSQQKPAAVVLVDQNPRTRGHRDAVAGLDQLGLVTFEAVVQSSTALRTAGGGVPGRRAMWLYRAVWDELLAEYAGVPA